MQQNNEPTNRNCTATINRAQNKRGSKRRQTATHRLLNVNRNIRHGIAKTNAACNGARIQRQRNENHYRAQTGEARKRAANKLQRKRNIARIYRNQTRQLG